MNAINKIKLAERIRFIEGLNDEERSKETPDGEPVSKNYLLGMYARRICGCSTPDVISNA